MTPVETSADREVRACLEQHRSFALVAGAGSGKTRSLIEALELIRKDRGRELRRNGQRIACITYTNRAVEVIRSRLRFDELFAVSTIHSFLWSAMQYFQSDIRNVLRSARIPALISRAKARDNGGNGQEARRARERVLELEGQLAQLETTPTLRYEDVIYSNYSTGQLGHDDVIEVASHLLLTSETFRAILGYRFPYILVDEAQDTYTGVVDGLNLAAQDTASPLIGYFGDPWQQIYDERAATFAPPPGGLLITKRENFRCSRSVVRFLNAFRCDVEQYPAGENRDREGSVIMRLVQAEDPTLPRRRYSQEQIDRALGRLDQALSDWTWQGREDEVRLFLVRQMIARRLGFAEINALFTGVYASGRAQEQYEAGEHFLLKPLRTMVCPLIAASRRGEQRRVIDLLRSESPDFALDGPNRGRPLQQMIAKADEVVQGLNAVWSKGNFREVLRYCRDHGLWRFSERLKEAVEREPRSEEFNEQIHATEKSDWLCDRFLAMGTGEVDAYSEFVNNSTAFSTQHGVKGEQHQNVLVVFDDTEAAWNNYSFAKLLTPATSGQSSGSQLDRSRRLAYVCFSRALENLRVILFSPDPAKARTELIERKLLPPEQIEIAR